ncbi:hypothetical protein RFI_12663 [Reticulomyxa filosa]|uniref:RNA-dependent RNA polymerase n=1 Tax=Reticulomyxa filosa TaxID=46433 RepID=X6NF13_RETFI|nr:hypothetical protein RFI_12663 [Reticulomyxa filosa]|eukprot:ETO24493.1 hypothetical protein RFI_12663 [Reticulomyxa filosa]
MSEGVHPFYPRRTLFVSNIRYGFTALELKHFLERQGYDVDRVYIDSVQQRHMGTGKIVFSSPSEAKRASKQLFNIDSKYFIFSSPPDRQLGLRRPRRGELNAVHDEESESDSEDRDIEACRERDVLINFAIRSVTYSANNQLIPSFQIVKSVIFDRVIFNFIKKTVTCTETSSEIVYSFPLRLGMETDKDGKRIFIELDSPGRLSLVGTVSSSKEWDTDEEPREVLFRAQSSDLGECWILMMHISPRKLSKLEEAKWLDRTKSQLSTVTIQERDPNKEIYTVNNIPAWIKQLKDERVIYLLICLHSRTTPVLTFQAMDECVEFKEFIIDYVNKGNKADITKLCVALRTLHESKKWMFNPKSDLLQTLEACNCFIDSCPSYCARIRRCWRTLSKTEFFPEYTEESNRVIRWLKNNDHFLRVHFCDDKGFPLPKPMLQITVNAYVYTYIQNRVIVRHKIFDRGICVGDRCYVFLAYSSSQLNENSAWFYYQGDSNVSADDLRARMGDLSHIKSVPKYAARMGQNFTTTQESIKTDVKKKKKKALTMPTNIIYAHLHNYEMKEDVVVKYDDLTNPFPKDFFECPDIDFMYTFFFFTFAKKKRVKWNK